MSKSRSRLLEVVGLFFLKNVKEHLNRSPVFQLHTFVTLGNCIKYRCLHKSPAGSICTFKAPYEGGKSLWKRGANLNGKMFGRFLLL